MCSCLGMGNSGSTIVNGDWEHQLCWVDARDIRRVKSPFRNGGFDLKPEVMSENNKENVKKHKKEHSSDVSAVRSKRRRQLPDKGVNSAPGSAASGLTMSYPRISFRNNKVSDDQLILMEINRMDEEQKKTCDTLL